MCVLPENPTTAGSLSRDSFTFTAFAWRSRTQSLQRKIFTKALVAEARNAWREAHAAKGGRLWMKHVKGHSGDRWNDRADGLADEGRRGTRRSGADSAFGWA